MNTIRKINKNKEVDNKYSTGTIILDKPEHKEATGNMNDAMEVVRKDYKLKDSNSQASAAKIVLTT